MDTAVLDAVRDTGIVPVIKLESPDKAIGLGKALLKGGINVAEITFRTAAAEESIARLSAELPELIVGAGTVTRMAQLKAAKAAGARFVVAPGFNPAIVDYCVENAIPVIPGVDGTAGVEQGIERGLSVLKFFPAEASGGVAKLDALAGPYSGMSFLPTGGVDMANIGSYVRRPNVWAVGGSWMVKPDLIEGEKWDAIEALCREAVLALHGFSFAHVGVNGPDGDGAADAVSRILSLFGIPAKEGSSSYMIESLLEITKKPFPGTHGHLAIRTNSVERAAAYFAKKGVAIRPDTAKTEKGRMKAVYLDLDILGFAVHLLRA